MTSGPTVSMNSSSSPRRSAVPVGLLGLQTSTTRVRGLIAAAIAGRSCPWSARFGTRTLVAPVVAATIG
jgi:hypothetical protein